MKFTSLLIFLVLMVTSCDPSRRISMVNQTDSEAWVGFKLLSDSVNVSPLYISNSKLVEFPLMTKNPHDRVTMSFGIGNWNPISLRNFVDDLESMEIRSSSGQLNIESQDSIYQFLSLRRRGFGKTRIQINIR